MSRARAIIRPRRTATYRRGSVRRTRGRSVRRSRIPGIILISGAGHGGTRRGNLGASKPRLMHPIQTARRHWRYSIRNARPGYEQSTTACDGCLQCLAGRLHCLSRARAPVRLTDGRVSRIAIRRTERDPVLQGWTIGILNGRGCWPCARISHKVLANRSST
jgi:hypothetical protein